MNKLIKEAQRLIATGNDFEVVKGKTILETLEAFKNDSNTSKLMNICLVLLELLQRHDEYHMLTLGSSLKKKLQEESRATCTKVRNELFKINQELIN